MKQTLILLSIVLLPLTVCANVSIYVNHEGTLQQQYESNFPGSLKSDHVLSVQGNLNVDDIKFLRSKMMNDDDEWIEDLNLEETLLHFPLGEHANEPGIVLGYYPAETFENVLQQQGMAKVFYSEGWYYSDENKLHSYLFDGCETLRRLVLPFTVRGLGCFSVSNCENLEELVISSNYIENAIWKYACGPRDIRPLAVFNCPRLRIVTLPYFLESVGAMAFYECNALECVFTKSNICPPAYGYNCFPHPETLQLIVLTDVTSKNVEVSTYSTAAGWNQFGSITTMPLEEYITTTTTISDHQQSASDEAIYDVQGRHLTGKPKRGLYIKNGKKHVVLE